MATAAPLVPHALPFDNYLDAHDYAHAIMGSMTELPALSAEQYDDAAARRSKARKPAKPRPAPVTGKRNRTAVKEESPSDEDQNATGGDDEQGKKRLRGRPRLDPKDETAADRRRTQIRLAQRAYRHRKDTAITTLERRVKNLESAKDTMNKEFTDFYELLVQEHVFDASPHLVQRLTSMASRFSDAVDAAKAPSEDGSGSDGGDEPAPRKDPSRPASGNVSAQVTPPAAAVVTVPGPAPPVPGPASDVGSGYVPAPAPQPVASVGNNMPMMVNNAAAVTASPMIHMPASLSYEVVTQPTRSNASFPFYSSMEPTAGEDFTGAMAGPSPFSVIGAPATYSASEMTFGRRLQRFTTEAAFRLICLPSPPPKRFTEVFGFSLMYESRADIVRRLEFCMSRAQHEDLCHWASPFTNLGGAGTHFPQDGTDAAAQWGPAGNQGASHPGRPQELTSFSMGPFVAGVQQVRDERLDGRTHITVPGFEGGYFDTDEIELYLRRLGVFIPQRADFVEAEINLVDLEALLDTPQSTPVVGRQQKPLESLGGSDSGYGGSGPADAETTPPGEPGYDYMSTFVMPADRWWPARAKITVNVPQLIKGEFLCILF